MGNNYEVYIKILSNFREENIIPWISIPKNSERIIPIPGTVRLGILNFLQLPKVYLTKNMKYERSICIY